MVHGGPLACRWFMVKEDLYGYTSGTTGVNGTCDATRTATITEGDKVQLTGGGFNQLQSWSAKALRQVNHRAGVLACRPSALCTGRGQAVCSELSATHTVLRSSPAATYRRCYLPLPEPCLPCQPRPICCAGGAEGARHGGLLRAGGQPV